MPFQRKPPRTASPLVHRHPGLELQRAFEFGEGGGLPWMRGHTNTLATLGGVSAYYPTWAQGPHGIYAKFNSNETNQGYYTFPHEAGDVFWPWDTNTIEMLFRFHNRGEGSLTRQRVWGISDGFEFHIKRRDTNSISDYSLHYDIFSTGSPELANTYYFLEGPWYHVVGVADGRVNPGRRSLYVNGIITETITKPPVLSDADTTAFRLGQRVGGATGDGFSGEIAYLRFFTGLATEAQALEMYLNMWDSRPVEYAPAGTTYPESAADILDLGDSASPSFGGTVKIIR